jgi:hypothetical protein
VRAWEQARIKRDDNHADQLQQRASARSSARRVEQVMACI